MGAAQMVGGFVQAGLGFMAQDAQQQASEADYKQNKMMAEAAARDAIDRGRRAEGLRRMQGSQVIAQQKVAFGASGVDGTVGTPVDAAANTRMFSEMDAQTLQNNAAREAWGFKQVTRKLDRQMQQDIEQRPYKAAGTLLGGLGGAAAGYGQMSKGG